MSIEQVITTNTEALHTLTAAIRDMLSVALQPPESLSTQLIEAPTRAPKRAKAKTAETPASEAQWVPVPVTEVLDTVTAMLNGAAPDPAVLPVAQVATPYLSNPVAEIPYSEVRAVTMELSAPPRDALIARELLQTFGVFSAKDLKVEQYAEYIRRANDIINKS